MNNSIQIFNNNEFSIRTTTDNNGNIWFVAKDIALALDYAEESNPARLFAHVPLLWKGLKLIHTPGRAQNMICLTEQGVYFFLGRSDKKKALLYQMWIAGEVIPSIRKIGSYNSKHSDSTGHSYLGMLPECSEKWYTAGEIGEAVGLSANMVGRIAKTNGLKAHDGESNEFGRWIFSKSMHSNREVPSFIYNEDALDWFKHFQKGEIA